MERELHAKAFIWNSASLCEPAGKRGILFEFKIDQTAQIAVEQIKHKGYYQFFQGHHLPIFLVGVNFDGNKRIIDDWVVEAV